MPFALSFENTGTEGPRSLQAESFSVASFQHGALESRLTWMFPEASLRAWMPAIHAGMSAPVMALYISTVKVRAGVCHKLRSRR